MKILITQPFLKRDDHEGNLRAIRGIVAEVKQSAQRPDFLVLPELFFRTDDLEAYEQFLRWVTAETGACVIGGSVRARVPPDGEGLYNAGLVIAPNGNRLASYTKRHPYGPEVALGTMPGQGLAQFTWRDCRCAVLICADAWDSRLLTQLTAPPDILFIIAASVSEDHGPEAARRLWHALAVTRAFELTSIVAISDWPAGPPHPHQVQSPHLAPGADTPLLHQVPSGVAGLADPSDLSGNFQPMPPGVMHYPFTIDRERLRRLRTTRQARHFHFWNGQNSF